MAVRRIATIQCVEELNLKPETLRTLNSVGIDVRELVLTAQNDTIWQTYSPNSSYKSEANQLTYYSGIGKARAKEIMKAVDEAGFILHESERSRNARRLVTAVFGSPQAFIEQYEFLEDMSPEALTAINEIVHDALSVHERMIIENYFGLEDGHCCTVENCANKLGVILERAQQLLNIALAKLHKNSYRLKLKVATCYSYDVLFSRMVNLQYKIRELQMQLDLLKVASPYPKLRAGVTLIEDLDISKQTYNLLRRAGISTVEQLSECTDEELIRIGNFSCQQLEKVRTACVQLATTTS